MKLTTQRHLIATILSLAAAITVLQTAQAQTSPVTPASCEEYFMAVQNIDGNASGLPPSLLSDPAKAATCLAKVLDKVGASIAPDQPLPDNTRTQLLATTGALRSIIVAAANYDTKYGSINNGQVDTFTNIFRQANTINAASALAYGMRDDNKSLRLNSLLVLSNVVDNNTLCVPLVQLNDPTLKDSPLAINGRANLLGTISTVAPWVNIENSKNLNNTITAINTDLGSVQNQPDFSRTFELIRNVNARTAKQTVVAKIGSMDPIAKAACAAYASKFKVDKVIDYKSTQQ